MKRLFFVLTLILTAQAAYARCSKELLSAEEAERGSWTMNFGISGQIVEVLNGMRSGSDVTNAAGRIYCILVDAEMPRSIQYSFLSSAVGNINLSNAREYHLRAVAEALADYGASLSGIERRHDADSVSILVFEKQSIILSYYLSALRQRGIQEYTEGNLPQLVRTRKLEDYREDVERTDLQVAELLAQRNNQPPNIGTVLAALEKDEGQTLRFLERDRLRTVRLFIGDWNEPTEALRIVNGEPKNIVSFQEWSDYIRAVADFEDRDVGPSEKFIVECRFSPDAIVSYGQQTDTWQLTFVEYRDRRLVFDCSET